MEALTYRRGYGFPHEASVGSPLEGVFWYEFRKVASEELFVFTQAECQCSDDYRPFFVDFLLALPSRTIGIECDGYEYHQDRSKDAFRDSVLIGAGFAKRIFRLRGFDVYHRIHDLFSLLLRIEPGIFSMRGKCNIESRSRIGQIDDFIWKPGKRKGWIGDFPGIAVREFKAKKEEDSDDCDDPEDDNLRSPIIVRYSGEKIEIEPDPRDE